MVNFIPREIMLGNFFIALLLHLVWVSEFTSELFFSNTFKSEFSLSQETKFGSLSHVSSGFERHWFVLFGLLVLIHVVLLDTSSA